MPGRCLLLLPALVLVGGASARELSVARFGNLFIEGQPVEVTVGPGDAVTLELRGLEQHDAVGVPASDTPRTVAFAELSPGYYEAIAGDVVLPLVVVIDPAQRVPGPSRVSTDNAMSWLVDGEHFEDVAELLRLVGVRSVRERLTWGEIEPERGTHNAGRYDRSADALAERGIEVYQIFHSIPRWARADGDTKRAPDDLRDVHRFASWLAQHFDGRVGAWEVWNEPDIGFFNDTASEMAAFQKAAFLGFRQADPEQLVLGPSIAHGAGPFSDHLMANGVGDYLDIWNYHVYADTQQYRQRHEGWLAQMREHGIDVPVWVTEAGARLEGPEGILARPQRIEQAAFLSRAFPTALALGIERHHWFVFPFYREGERGWGLFEPDEAAPYPAIAALSTVTYALGRGEPLGRLAVGEGNRAEVFDRGDGTVAVAVWRDADGTADVALPLQRDTVLDARGHLGAPLQLEAGPLRLQASGAAQFVIVPREALTAIIPPAARPAVERRPAPGLASVVARLRVSDLPVNKDADVYLMAGDAAAEATAEVYNFGTEPLTGELRLSADEGWAIEPAVAPVSVPPGERVAVPVTLRSPGHLATGSVRLEVVAGERRSSPAVVALGVDPGRLAALAERSLDIEAAERWQTNITGRGRMTIGEAPDGGVRFEFAFDGPGDNWAYPQALFDPPLDLSGFDALRFDYRTSDIEPGAVRVMVVERDGASYFTSQGLPGAAEWREATVPFSALSPLGQGGADPNGRLDLDAVARVRVGVNARPLALTLDVRNLRAVRLRER